MQDDRYNMNGDEIIGAPRKRIVLTYLMNAAQDLLNAPNHTELHDLHNSAMLGNLSRQALAFSHEMGMESVKTLTFLADRNLPDYGIFTRLREGILDLQSTLLKEIL